MIEKWCLKGQVDKIKVLKLEEMPLVRFTLVVDEEHKENCLIKHHSLNFYSRPLKEKLLLFTVNVINETNLL
jgi:hypothetical protein